MIEVSEWFLFIRKSIELIICALMGILVINNFLVKLYVPGEYIYPKNPCGPPYMKPTSKDKFDRINVYKKVPSEQVALKRSLYEVCERRDEPGTFFEGHPNQKELLEFLNSITTDATSLDLVDLYNVIRNKNREKAMVPSHYGLIDQLMWSVGIMYLTSNISVRRMLGAFHDALGGLCMDKSPFVFYLAFILFIGLSFYTSGEAPFSGPINAIVLMFSAFGIMLSFSGILFLLFNMLNMIMYCSSTAVFTIPIGGVVTISLVLSILQSALMAIQFFIFFFVDPFLNTKIRSLSLCELQNYKKGVIIILLIFTLLTAIKYLSFENMIIVALVSVVTAIYGMTRPNAEQSKECISGKQLLHKLRSKCEDKNTNNTNNNVNSNK